MVILLVLVCPSRNVVAGHHLRETHDAPHILANINRQCGRTGDEDSRALRLGMREMGKLSVEQLLGVLDRGAHPEDISV